MPFRRLLNLNLEQVRVLLGGRELVLRLGLRRRLRRSTYAHHHRPQIGRDLIAVAAFHPGEVDAVPLQALLRNPVPSDPAGHHNSNENPVSQPTNVPSGPRGFITSSCHEAHTSAFVAIRSIIPRYHDCPMIVDKRDASCNRSGSGG